MKLILLYTYIQKDLWVSAKELSDLAASISAAWVSQDIDVVIGPGFPFVAPPINYPAAYLAAVPCVGVYNCLDFPVGSVPVTNENAEDQARLDDYHISDHFDILDAKLRDGLRGAEGLPLGVQVVGRRFQEEMVLHAMKELEASRKENGNFTTKISY